MMDWILIFLVWAVAFGFTGSLSSSQSVILILLGLLFFLISRDLGRNKRKIKLLIYLYWEKLLDYPNYPKDTRDKMLKLIEKMRKEARSVNKDSFYDKSFPLLFVIDGNRASVWSEYEKSVITPSYRYEKYYFSSHKTFNFLVRKLSAGLLKESEEEPMLVIRESDNTKYIEFLWVYAKPNSLKYEEKEICKFPSSLLYGNIKLFPGRTLRKYGFKKIDPYYPSSLEFNNNYFGIEIQK